MRVLGVSAVANGDERHDASPDIGVAAPERPVVTTPDSDDDDGDRPAAPIAIARASALPPGCRSANRRLLAAVARLPAADNPPRLVHRAGPDRSSRPPQVPTLRRSRLNSHTPRTGGAEPYPWQHPLPITDRHRQAYDELRMNGVGPSEWRATFSPIPLNYNTFPSRDIRAPFVGFQGCILRILCASCGGQIPRRQCSGRIRPAGTIPTSESTEP